MTLREKITQLASIEENPSVTISINTHKTHPENLQDKIVIKNALKEAEERILNDFEKRDVADLLEKLNRLEDSIDVNQNLNSLHIFLSKNKQEIIKSWVTIPENRVAVDDHFLVRSLMKDLAKSKEYLILFLSQNETKLFEAMNDGVVEEIVNDDFPFGENPNIIPTEVEKSDGKKVEAMKKEHYNLVDKALLKVQKELLLDCYVVTNEKNYSLLLEVADNASVYKGYVDADFQNKKPHQLAEQVWQLVEENLKKEKAKKIESVKESVGEGLVLTELQDIYKAAIDGRGETLVVHQDFVQPVRMTGDRSFEVLKTDEKITSDIIDDITTNIAWEVLSKNGDVVFTTQDEIKDLGKIVLKARY